VWIRHTANFPSHNAEYSPGINLPGTILGVFNWRS
jgi:hypothetical protein